MGTWSITPNTLASIDNSGRATFQEHTSQVVYTITYTSTTCGTVTKQFTVYPCTQECTCSTTGGLTVPAEASETEVQVGTYSSSNCGGSWSTPTLRSGTDFLKDFRFADGKIYAKVKSTNTDADTRDAQYDTGIDTCADYFTIYQSGTGVCDCNAANLSITGVTDIPASGGTHVKIADFKSECYPTFSYSRKEGDNFLSSFGTHYNLVNKSGYTYADVSQNTGNESRSETVNMSIGTDVCKTFTVTQAKGICTPELTVSAAGNCCVNFKVVQPCSDIQQYDIIEWGYNKVNSPTFDNGQAFSSKSATGATGISQCPSITSDGNWYIFWRNRTAHSVSGSQIVNLTGCSSSLEYNIILKVPEIYNYKGLTYIILGSTALTPTQIEQKTTGSALLVGVDGSVIIGLKNVSSIDCNYLSYTFGVSYNIPNDTNWKTDSIVVGDTYTIINIDGSTVTRIGIFSMQDVDFNGCSDTVYNVS